MFVEVFSNITLEEFSMALMDGRYADKLAVEG